jgi:hypothetical protein
MRRQRGLVGLTGLVALVGLGLVARPTVAQVVTTEQNASILVFPKVISDGSRDTIIQITNTKNTQWGVHCFYVNGVPEDPNNPPGPDNLPLCMETDFHLFLTREQPTHWVVSTGRLYNPNDSACNKNTTCAPGTSGTTNADCCDAGFDPGHVPPVAPDFTGELICIAVDMSDAPANANALKGEATLEDLETGDVSKYNAIGVQSNDYAPDAATTGILCLGSANAPYDPDICPHGRQYAGCPAEWRFDHPATDAPDLVVEQQPFCTGSSCSSVETNLTLVPCTQDFETQALTTVTLQFYVVNEFEQPFTTSTSFSCWGSFNLGAPSGSLLPGVTEWFTAGSLGSQTLQTRIRSANGVNPVPIGVFAVLEETHQDNVNGHYARSAQNGHMIGERDVMDMLTVPYEQLSPLY